MNNFLTMIKSMANKFNWKEPKYIIGFLVILIIILILNSGGGTVYLEKETRDINFKSETFSTSDFFKGEKVIDIEGVKGKQEISFSYQNGEKVYALESRVILEKPVTERILMGTREPAQYILETQAEIRDYLQSIQDEKYEEAYELIGEKYKKVYSLENIKEAYEITKFKISRFSIKESKIYTNKEIATLETTVDIAFSELGQPSFNGTVKFYSYLQKDKDTNKEDFVLVPFGPLFYKILNDATFHEYTESTALTSGVESTLKISSVSYYYFGEEPFFRVKYQILTTVLFNEMELLSKSFYREGEMEELKSKILTEKQLIGMTSGYNESKTWKEIPINKQKWAKIDGQFIIENDNLKEKISKIQYKLSPKDKTNLQVSYPIFNFEISF